MKRTAIDRLTPEQKTLFTRAWTQTGAVLDEADKSILGRYADTWTKAATYNQSDPGEFYETLVNGGICQEDIRQIVAISSTPPSLARPEDDPLVKANNTDAGNAECLSYLHGQNMRYCETFNGWHVWDGVAWIKDKTGQVQRWTLDTARARFLAASKGTNAEARQLLAKWAIQSESTAKRQSALVAAQSIKEMAVTFDQFDKNPYLVTAQNRTINLEDGKSYDPKRHDLITKKLATKYDATAKCPRWLQFLDEVFENNHADEIIPFLKRAMGYSMTADIREQKMFLLHGVGANGKSVLMSTFNKLLGDYAGNTPFDTFDADTKEARNDLAKLRGTRLVSVIETNEDRRLNEARIKGLTGEDIVTAEAKYQDSYDYRPTCKIWVAMNHMPIVRADPSIKRRILVIKFLQSFEKRADKTLSKKLEAEMPGILNWLVEGAQQWLLEGLNEPQCIKDWTDEYIADMDIVAQWLEAHTLQDKTKETESGRAYTSYKDWCVLNGHRAESQNSFGRRLSAKGINKDKRGGKIYYLGFALTEINLNSPNYSTSEKD